MNNFVSSPFILMENFEKYYKYKKSQNLIEINARIYGKVKIFFSSKTLNEIKSKEKTNINEILEICEKNENKIDFLDNIFALATNKKGNFIFLDIKNIISQSNFHKGEFYFFIGEIYEENEFLFLKPRILVEASDLNYYIYEITVNKFDGLLNK